MSRGRLFGTLCAMAFLVNFGRIGFTPLLEPFMATVRCRDRPVVPLGWRWHFRCGE